MIQSALASSETAFKTYLDRLMNEVQMLDSKLELYIHILNRRQDRLAEFNIAPAFFGIVLNSLLSDVIISLSRLYDGKRSERNLIRFLNFIEQHRRLFRKREFKRRRSLPNGDWRLQRYRRVSLATINAHRRLIVTKEQVLQHLQIWRDKAYAHLDKKYFYHPRKLKVDAPLRFGDLRDLIKLAAKILNRYSVAFDGEFTDVRVLNVFDVDKVLDVLHRHRQSIEERAARLCITTKSTTLPLL